MVEVIGVTGTREGLKVPQRHTLVNVLQALRLGGANLLHHGDAIGVDAQTHQLWRDYFGGQVFIHPPDVDRYRAYCSWDGVGNFCALPKPYRVRDMDIVVAAEVMIVCPMNMTEMFRGSGTWATYRDAVKVDKPRIIIFPTGETRYEL